ncbi:MAG: hypothetical protein ABI581_12270, partial [Sediminibacterium sp.]
MKNKILSLLIFILIAGPAISQIPLVSYISTNGPAKYPTHIDSMGYGGFRVAKDTAERNAISTQRRKYGMAVYVQSNDSLYILKDVSLGNTNWYSFGQAPSVDLSGYAKFTDTATMLSPYLLNYYGLKYSDTASMLSGYTRSGQTLQISDTAAMLANRLKTTDTTAMLNGYTRSGQTLQISDTAAMLANRLKTTDTTAMLNGYTRSGQTLQISDTASMLLNRLKTTDTTAMLNGYTRSGQTLQISDTAAMLANRLKT